MEGWDINWRNETEWYVWVYVAFCNNWGFIWTVKGAWVGLKEHFWDPPVVVRCLNSTGPYFFVQNESHSVV